MSKLHPDLKRYKELIRDREYVTIADRAYDELNHQIFVLEDDLTARLTPATTQGEIVPMGEGTDQAPYVSLDEDYLDKMTTENLLRSAISVLQTLVTHPDARQTRFVETQITEVYRRLTATEAPEDGVWVSRRDLGLAYDAVFHRVRRVESDAKAAEYEELRKRLWVLISPQDGSEVPGE